MNITVLAGGLSPERDVSLSSGSLIANTLAELGNRVLLLDLYVGAAIPEGGIASMFSSRTDHTYKIPEHEPDLDALRSAYPNGGALIGENVLDICRASDVVFLALHGGIGENGKLQALFDIYGVRYTGNGYAPSLCAMDKDIGKHLLAAAGVPVPQGILIDARDPDAAKNIAGKVGFPCVIKPNGCGSSVGVSMVGSEAELAAALSSAAKFEPLVLAERRISGREFSIGVLGGRVLPPIEIIPLQGFYDYKNKYQSGMTREECPAKLDAAQNARISQLAADAYAAMRLDSYVRFDFLLDSRGGEFYCLEANTLPGMTPMSLLPQEAAAVGTDYPALCSYIAGSAKRRD